MKTHCIRSSLIHILIAVGSFAFSVGAQAAYIGSLSFIEPTGTVGANDAIPIWVRFTLDPASDPLILNQDADANPHFGVPDANVPTAFNFSIYDPDSQSSSYHSNGNFTELLEVYLNTSYTCSGTFTNSCSPDAYSFDFNTSGPDTINFIPRFNGDSFALQPGESRDYLFGSFTPNNGPVAPGTYTFYTTSLTLNFRGNAYAVENVLDENGDPIQQVDENGDPVFDEFDNPVYVTQTTSYQDVYTDIDLASTCGPGAPADCAFTREVTAVPAPAASWLFATAMAGVGSRLRRRRAA